MCTIGNVIKGVVGVASAVIPSAASYSSAKESLNYRTSLALKNMEEAKNDAKVQKQLGIEEARKQKIEGLRRANALMAQNASNGFSFDSGTNYLGYEDSVDSAYQNAFASQNIYNLRADNYYEKARNYLNDAKYYQKEKKNLGKGFALNMLGNSRSVASKWFSSSD